MQDTSIGRRKDIPPSCWKRQPSLTPHTPWPQAAPEEVRQCLPLDAPLPASDGESPAYVDFDDAIASW
ncbi:hypothetical protein OV208_33985 [Corallococcus sp. bb12-1]|uniref:hypothetical protein n=1 Tax=Corallococcus sp. bb12-1 TaxID=2996784 RepID=UPI00227131EB|nr:hypothetical protein [Corallococcus sp. bb12-1]MCY1046365.1 hypothetical protein [Corallococcus sp. bb12-1]